VRENEDFDVDLKKGSELIKQLKKEERLRKCRKRDQERRGARCSSQSEIFYRAQRIDASQIQDSETSDC
jgi:hypothetical protein